MNSPKKKTEIVCISYTSAHARKRSLPLQQADRTGWGLQRTGLPSQETPRSTEENLCADETIVHSENFCKEIGTFMKFLQGNGYIYEGFERKWVHL